MILDFIFLQSGNEALFSNVFLILMVIIFWFFFIRPQTKKAKEEQKFTQELEKGMEVVTKSGVIGKISKIETNVVTLQVDTKTFIKFTRGAISKELTDSYNKEEEAAATA